MTESTLPPCCTPSEGASLAERLFCVYNAGGPPDRAGLAWDGRPVPAWAELSADSPVRAKWEAVATFAGPRIEWASEGMARTE